MIALMWLSNAAYTRGDYVIYNGNLYVCVEDHSSGNTFDGSKWESTKVTYNIETIAENLATRWSPGYSYSEGTYLTYDYGAGPKLYRCRVSYSSTTWDSNEWTSVDLAGEIEYLYYLINSGSISATGAVKYNEAQSLTEAQQQQVYANLGFPNNTLAKLSYTVVT